LSPFTQVTVVLELVPTVPRICPAGRCTIKKLSRYAPVTAVTGSPYGAEYVAGDVDVPASPLTVRLGGVVEV
jgi:hypothetical protein